MEELALEASCFNMAVEHPWIILRRSVRGLEFDHDSNESQTSFGTANGHAESSQDVEMRNEVNGTTLGKGKGKSLLSEGRICDLGWTILNQV